MNRKKIALNFPSVFNSATIGGFKEFSIWRENLDAGIRSGVKNVASKPKRDLEDVPTAWGNEKSIFLRSGLSQTV